MAKVPEYAQELFNIQVPEALAKHPDKAKEIGAVYLFKITGDDGGTWTVDLAANPPALHAGRQGQRAVHPRSRARRLQADADQPGDRHAALLPGQAARHRRPDARHQAPEALLDGSTAMHAPRCEGVRVLDLVAAHPRSVLHADPLRPGGLRRQAGGPARRRLPARVSAAEERAVGALQRAQSRQALALSRPQEAGGPRRAVQAGRQATTWSSRASRRACSTASASASRR